MKRLSNQFYHWEFNIELRVIEKSVKKSWRCRFQGSRGKNNRQGKQQSYDISPTTSPEFPRHSGGRRQFRSWEKKFLTAEKMSIIQRSSRKRERKLEIRLGTFSQTSDFESGNSADADRTSLHSSDLPSPNQRFNIMQQELGEEKGKKLRNISIMQTFFTLPFTFALSLCGPEIMQYYGRSSLKWKFSFRSKFHIVSREVEWRLNEVEAGTL